MEMNINNKTRKNFNKKFLVLHWTPSEIVSGSTKYLPVAMPSCELYKIDSTNSCRYDIIPVSIRYNDPVRNSDELMQLIRMMHFQSLKPLIDLYEALMPIDEKVFLNRMVKEEEATESVEDYYNKIACKWLQENKNVYTVGHKESWIRKSNEPREISIGGM